MNVSDTGALQIFGKVAGIGGLSLFVFATLFREVIRKNIFPQLGKLHAYKIIRLFMVLVFLLSLSGVAVWAFTIYQNSDRMRGSATEAMAEWFSLVDHCRYKEAWESMPGPSSGLPGPEVAIGNIRQDRASRGNVISRIMMDSEPVPHFPGYAPGTCEVRNYLTRFEDGTQVMERLVAIENKDGWKVASHVLLPPPAGNPVR